MFIILNAGPLCLTIHVEMYTLLHKYLSRNSETHKYVLFIIQKQNSDHPQRYHTEGKAEKKNRLDITLVLYPLSYEYKLISF